jgi:ATP-dependent Clp protease ATP-binding subunit ClpC
MTDDIQSLIESLRRGQYEDPVEKISLLSAALQEKNADVALLLSLIRAPQVPLRLAAMDACRERKETELWSELLRLVDSPEQRIRQKLAEILGSRTDAAAEEVLRTLLNDADENVRQAALKSTGDRPEFRAAHEAALAKDSDWNVRHAAANALDQQKTVEVVKALFESMQREDVEWIKRRCAEVIEKHFQESTAAAAEQLPRSISELARAAKSLKELGGQRYPAFLGWITTQTTLHADPEALARFGTDLTALAEAGKLPRAHFVDEACDAILKLIQREPWRSIALLGPAGAGKSAVVNELVYQLARPEHGGWRVLRVSPTDFMSGTKYLGEWETKVHDLIDALRKPRRVLIYVPNLSDLSAVGTWSKSESSVATALAPYLEDGSILLLGESGPEEFERGIGKAPSLARLFDKVLLTEASVERTRDVLAAVRGEEKSHLPDEVLDQLLEVSDQFLGHICRPGNAVALLRAVIKSEKESGRILNFRDVLDALSKSTGVPADLLDDSIPLKPAELQDFFEKRIIGQPEAVEAVVDLVTMIKAGLTDPNKPFGVFLFVGPTGVGKTELARALAEFIFGDTDRLKRFDMSEFASPDGFTRLIGSQNDNGLLTDAVRQHPFSVVLLDEIEKAHLNVFDLCLQMFDAGRLTDGRGRTADFRRTIIILTSNIGATAGSTPPLGFGTPAAPSVDAEKDRTFRELSRFFRPEFLNRLDRIITFRPLSLQVAERIARREIDLVLQRSGIKRRQLVVDLDPAVVSLLVREGYSAHFGARPLKRTVERMLLLPLARAIASGSLRGRTVLRLTERNGRIEAVIAASAPAKSRPADSPESPAPYLTERFDELNRMYERLTGSIQPLADRKSELILKTRQPEFFRQADARSTVLGEIHNLDDFLSLHAGMGKVLTGLRERLARGPVSKTEEPAVRDKLEQLAGELAYLGFVARCRDSRDLGDALVVLSLVDRTGSRQGSAQKLAGLYQALAGRRRMTAEVLGEFYDDKRDQVYLMVEGLGAYALLKSDAGLHQFERRYKERAARSGRELIQEDRELLRVEVYPPVAKIPKAFPPQVKSKVAALKPARKRLLKAEFSLSLFHEPSVRSVELWVPGPKEAALECGLKILHAQTSAGERGLPDGMVRQYSVGLSPKIKDPRTGRTTTRIERVFKGELGLLLDVDGAVES